jgi:hypothetical protein
MKGTTSETSSFRDIGVDQAVKRLKMDADEIDKRYYAMFVFKIAVVEVEMPPHALSLSSIHEQGASVRLLPFVNLAGHWCLEPITGPRSRALRSIRRWVSRALLDGRGTLIKASDSRRSSAVGGEGTEVDVGSVMPFA